MAHSLWMPIYWGDYFRDTLHLTHEDHGAYLLLIGAYWVRGSSLPDEDKFLATVTRMSGKKWKIMRPKISEFFEISEGYWRHERIENELLRSSDRQASAIANGRAGGLAKSKLPTLTPTQTEESKKVLSFNSFVVGRGSTGREDVTIQDPTKRIVIFQQKLLPYLGPEGSRIIDIAMHPAHPEHTACLALCKKTAWDNLRKGWPRNWPAYDLNQQEKK